MFIKLTLMTVCVMAVAATPEYNHFIQERNGIDVHQDIMFDEEEQIAIITVGPMPGHFCGATQTVNFHDFKTGYMAFKDINATVCHVSQSPLPGPIPELYHLKKSPIVIVSHVTEDDVIMTPAEIKLLAGERIYAFCREYNTYRMHLSSEKNRNRRAAKRGCGWWASCNVCSIEMD